MKRNDDNQLNLMLRGQVISEDDQGRICLDDIWEAAGANPTKAPKHWRLQKAPAELTEALQKKVTADYLKANVPNQSVIHADRGRGAKGTFAHPVLAAAYAGYLSPKLEIEIREVWLRFRAGDAKLADEVLDRASPEDNEWAAKRALSRSTRAAFTDCLKAHGVNEGKEFAQCTNATYQGLFGSTAKELKQQRQLSKKASLRDSFSLKELATVSFAEVLSTDRIEDEQCFGFRECHSTTSKVAKSVRSLIDRDMQDRQRRLVS